MTNQEKFEVLVMLFAKHSESGNLEFDEEITKFEDAIEETGCGQAYFGIAKMDWERIDIVEPRHIPYKYRDSAKFFANYYDGFQAPFVVCYWNDEFEKLEELLKNTSNMLYEMYENELKKQ